MKLSRRAFLTGGAGLVVAGALPVASAYRFQVSQHVLDLPGLGAPLRVVQLSDLHYGPFIRLDSLRAWVDAALRERADLIVITGDLVDSEVGESLAPLLGELARLRAPLGVWAVWGNHDYGSFGTYARRLRGPGRPDWPSRRAHFQAQLREAGVRVLRNEGRLLRPDLYLAGIDDLWWGDVELEKAIARRPPGGVTLLLSHNPDILPSVPEDISLTLCGHTHGGQVRLPGLGALTTSSRYGERFAQGFVRAPARGFISRGLGVSLLPLRVNCAPEVVVLDLRPAPSSS